MIWTLFWGPRRWRKGLCILFSRLKYCLVSFHFPLSSSHSLIHFLFPPCNQQFFPWPIVGPMITRTRAQHFISLLCCQLLHLILHARIRSQVCMLMLSVSMIVFNQMNLSHKIIGEGPEVDQAPHHVASEPETDSDPDTLGTSFRTLEIMSDISFPS